jgi:hypothetical protein
MSKPMIRIHDLETNEIVDREMTEAEFQKYTTEKTLSDAAKAQTQAKEAAKAELLAKLGITAEEAALLLG